MSLKISKIIFISLFSFILLNGCKNGKLPGADARKVPYSAEERVKRHLESGKGFRLDNAFKLKKGGDFEFASSNELWRASLDVIDFMPLASANYSGGMIITDWYTDNSNPKDSIKVTIRFLTNEVRSDALSIKVFYKKCLDVNNCIVEEKSGILEKELKKEILKLAAKYKAKKDNDNFKEYSFTNIKDNKKK
tara:strand:- start:503 stop:1078 length:576 start_codon:yes stop_codon:yes gene_type:complete